MHVAPTAIVPQLFVPPPVQLRLLTLLSVTLTLFSTSLPVFVTVTVTPIGWPGPEAFWHTLATLNAGVRGTLQVASSLPDAGFPVHAPVPFAVAVSVNGPHWSAGGM